MFANKIATWSAVPSFSATAVAPTQDGIAVQETGTPAGIAPAATNLFTMATRRRYSSTAVAGTAGGIRGGALAYGLSTVANVGGFFFVCRFGLSASVSTNRVFVGMSQSQTGANAAPVALNAGLNPSTYLQSIGLYADTTMTSFGIMSNGATAVAQAAAFGALFPAQTSSLDFYEFRLYAAQGQNTRVDWSLVRLNTSDIIQGSLTANLPTLLMAPHVMHGNGTTTAIVSVDIQTLYLETDN
jgi:hypothetical protein